MASSKDWVSRVKALVEGSNSTTSSLADSAGTVKQTKVDKPPTASPPDSTPKGTTQKLDAVSDRVVLFALSRCADADPEAGPDL